jgi:hypothetical protein
MSYSPTTTSAGPWRLLVLDTEPGDAKWIVATVASPADVRPAGPGAALDDMTAAWVARRAGLDRPALTALPGARCWRVDSESR